ncbi:MAG: co-chaperone DjlA [Gammaproteobacteria bacterium]|nr:co-chaperone DjlA [Gammaproteobacteria bacterium]
MTWTGRIVMVVFGYLAAGVWGAALGFVAGYWVDRARAAPRAGAGGANSIQHVFFDTTFSVMGHLSKADGAVTQAEIGVAEALMARMSLSAQARQEAIACFNRGKRDDFELDAALDRFRSACRWQANLVRVFLEIQLQTAFADGNLKPAERSLLLRIAERLGLTQQEFARLEALLRGWYTRGRGEPDNRNMLEDAHELLGTAKDASDAEIKKAYRRLMNQHHPDKLAARGLPTEMMKVAEEKTVRIRAAYDTIREARAR